MFRSTASPITTSLSGRADGSLGDGHFKELVAPISVEFYSFEGVKIGDKHSMVQYIHDITGISIPALRGSPPSQFSVDERRSWAANRQPKREEDAAYSLLGTFDIHMPLIYGEGRKKAFARLERKIKKSLEDQPLVIPLSRLSTQQSIDKWGLFPPRPNGEDTGVEIPSDTPGILNDHMGVLEHVEVDKDTGVAPRCAVPVFEDDKPRPRGRANVLENLDGLMEEFHGLQLEGQGWETVLKRIFNHARHSVDADERTRSRSRTKSGNHDEAFDSLPEFLRENTKDKKKDTDPKLTRDEPGAASRHREMFSHQVGMSQIATNTLSNLSSPTNPTSNLWQHLPELESYVKGGTSLLY